jgi:hypothetical protein
VTNKASPVVDDQYFYQSSSTPILNTIEEIENELDMKPQEKKIAQRISKRAKYSTNRKKKPKTKQHIIDEDSSLENSVMTQGWGVTKERTPHTAVSVGDSVFNDSNFSSAKNRKIKQVTERLYNSHLGNHHKHENLKEKPPKTQRKIVKKPFDRRSNPHEWITSKGKAVIY